MCVTRIQRGSIRRSSRPPWRGIRPRRRSRTSRMAKLCVVCFHQHRHARQIPQRLRHGRADAFLEQQRGLEPRHHRHSVHHWLHNQYHQWSVSDDALFIDEIAGETYPLNVSTTFNAGTPPTDMEVVANLNRREKAESGTRRSSGASRHRTTPPWRSGMAA